MDRHNTFVEKAKNKFGNRYDYSLDTYIKNTQKMIFKCNICDTTFMQTPSNHLYGYDGCTTCALKHKRESHSKSQEQCIKDFKSVHRISL